MHEQGEEGRKLAISLGGQREGERANSFKTHLPDEFTLLGRVWRVAMVESDVLEVTWRRSTRGTEDGGRTLGRLEREGRRKEREIATNRSLASESL